MARTGGYHDPRFDRGRTRLCMVEGCIYKTASGLFCPKHVSKMTDDERQLKAGTVEFEDLVDRLAYR